MSDQTTIEVVDSTVTVIGTVPIGPRGLTGPQGDDGPTGDPGEGVPAGGDTGQVLAKASDTDFDTEWVEQSGGGGAVDSVNGETGVVVLSAADVGADPSGTAAGLVATEAGTRAAADTALDGRLDAIEGLGSLATDAELAAEATLARNGDNITSGTVADARIASTIARDSEVTSAVGAEATARDAAIEVHRADTTNVHGITDTSALLTDADLEEITDLPAASALDGSELAPLSQGGIAAQRSYTNILGDLVVVRGTGNQTSLAGTKEWTADHEWDFGADGRAAIVASAADDTARVGVFRSGDTTARVSLAAPTGLFGVGVIEFTDGSGGAAQVFSSTGNDLVSSKGLGAAGKTGATATPMYLAGGTASGAPASGAHLKGELVCDDTGVLYRCTVAGTPGTWVVVNSTVQQPLRLTQTALGTTGGNIDFATATGTTLTVAASGAVTFTGSNYDAGRWVQVIVDAGASNRSMTYPSWTGVGPALPTTLLANKRLFIYLYAQSTTAASVTATGNVQP